MMSYSRLPQSEDDIELVEVKVESAQEAERPLIRDVMSIAASYDINSLSRLNEWRQALPEAVKRLSTAVDEFITPYLNTEPSIRKLVELSDAGEFKKTDEQEAIEFPINLALKRLEDQPLPQQIECLEAVLTRRFVPNTTVSEVHEDEVCLLEDRKSSTLFEENHEVNSVYQDLQKFYSEGKFSGHTDFIDFVILNCLIQKTLLEARIVDENNQNSLAVGQRIIANAEAVQGTAATLTAQEQQEESRSPFRWFLLICFSLVATIGAAPALYRDGLERENNTEQEAAVGVGIGGPLFAFLLWVIKEISAECTARAAERARNRSGLFRAAAVRTAELLETKPDDEKESVQSPRGP